MQQMLLAWVIYRCLAIKSDMPTFSGFEGLYPIQVLCHLLAECLYLLADFDVDRCNLGVELVVFTGLNESQFEL